MRRPPREPQQTRSRKLVATILEAGESLVLDQGIERFTIAQLCDRAGVSPGSLYQYFPDKAAVVAAVLEKLVDERWHSLEDSFDDVSHLSLREALGHLTRDAARLSRDLHRIVPSPPRWLRNQLLLDTCAPAPASPICTRGPSQAHSRAVQDRMKSLLAAHAHTLQMDVDHAATLLTQGVAAMHYSILTAVGDDATADGLVDTLAEMCVNQVLGYQARGHSSKSGEHRELTGYQVNEKLTP